METGNHDATPAPDSSPRIKPARRWVKVVLRIGISLLILLVLARFAWDFLAAAALDRKIAQLEKDGYAITLRALAPLAVKPENNAAPHFLEAFDLTSELEPEGTVRALRNGGPASLSASDIAALEDWVETNSASLKVFEATRKYPACRFEFDYSQAIFSSLPESFRDGLTRGTDLLTAAAWMEASKGRHESARLMVRDILRLSEALYPDPTPAANIVGVGMHGTALKTLQLCIDAETPDVELAKWLAILPAEDRLLGLTAFATRAYLAGMAEAFDNDLEKFWESSERPRPTFLEGHLLKPRVYGDLARELEWVSQLEKAARLPLAEAMSRRVVILSQADASIPWWSTSSNKFLKVIAKPFKYEVVGLSALAVVKAGIEFERAFITSGRYPESTSVQDPYMGVPLRVDLERGFISCIAEEGDEADLDSSLRWTLRRR